MGVINLPLLGEVSVKGLTVAGLEQKLKQLYDKYIYDPQVGVLVSEFQLTENALAHPEAFVAALRRAVEEVEEEEP